MAQHSFEIVDVAVHVDAEFLVGFVMLLHRAHFAGIEQRDRAAGENAAFAAQVRGPGAFRHFGRQDPGQVDRGGIEAFGDQRGAAGKIAVHLFLGAFARTRHPAFQIAGQFVDPGQLIAHLQRGFACAARCAVHRFFQPGDHLRAAALHHAGQRGAGFLAKARGHRADFGGSHLAKFRPGLVRRGLKFGNRAGQPPLDRSGQRIAFALRGAQCFAQGGQPRLLLFGAGQHRGVDRRHLAQHRGQPVIGGADRSSQGHAGHSGLIQRGAQRFDLMPRGFEPGGGGAQRFGDAGGGIGAGRLDQFEQAHRRVGQIGNRGIGARQRAACGVEPRGQRGQRAIDNRRGARGIVGAGVDRRGERRHAFRKDIAGGCQLADVVHLALALRGDRPVDFREPGFQRVGTVGRSRCHRRAALPDGKVQLVQPFGKAVGHCLQRGFERGPARGHRRIDLVRLVDQRLRYCAGAFLEMLQPLARPGDQAVVIAADILDRVAERGDQRAYIGLECGDPVGQRGKAGLFGISHHLPLTRQFVRQRIGACTDRGKRCDLFLVQPGALAVKRVDHRAQPHFAGEANAFGRGGKGFERGIDRAAHFVHLACAGGAEFVEPVESRDQRFELGIGIMPGMRDRIGDILGRIADHRQMRAQRGDVFQRLGRNGADLVHRPALIADQVFQPLGGARQPVDRDAAKRFEIARLRGDEIARQRQFGVHRRQPRIELPAFRSQRAHHFGIAAGARKPGAGDQHTNQHQRHRQRPLRDCTGDGLRIGMVQQCGALCHHDKRGPAGDRNCGKPRDDPAQRRSRQHFGQRLYIVEADCRRVHALFGVAGIAGHVDGPRLAGFARPVPAFALRPVQRDDAWFPVHPLSLTRFGRLV